MGQFTCTKSCSVMKINRARKRSLWEDKLLSRGIIRSWFLSYLHHQPGPLLQNEGYAECPTLPERCSPSSESADSEEVGWAQEFTACHRRCLGNTGLDYGLLNIPDHRGSRVDAEIQASSTSSNEAQRAAFSTSTSGDSDDQECWANENQNDL